MQQCYSTSTYRSTFRPIGSLCGVRELKREYLFTKPEKPDRVGGVGEAARSIPIASPEVRER